MKIITKYQAIDGHEFVDEATCLNHEAILRNIEMVMSHLIKSPESYEFQNGHGFIQQRPSDVELVKNAIIDMWMGDEQICMGARQHPARLSILARIFSDCNSPLQKPWHRLCCIDDCYREWGQMFFAINPDQGEQVKLNP